MGRVRLEIPEVFGYSTEIPVRITDINYGGHLGNDALLGLLHEARVRFLRMHGFSEQNVEGLGIIMTDAVVVYRAEVFYSDTLRIDVAAADPSPVGCDIFYRVSRVEDGAEVARAKTGITFFDYERRKVSGMPDKFLRQVIRPAGHTGKEPV